MAWRELWSAPFDALTRGGAVERFVAEHWDHRSWHWLNREDGTFSLGHDKVTYRVRRSDTGTRWVFEWGEE